MEEQQVRQEGIFRIIEERSARDPLSQALLRSARTMYQEVRHGLPPGLDEKRFNLFLTGVVTIGDAIKELGGDPGSVIDFLKREPPEIKVVIR